MGDDRVAVGKVGLGADGLGAGQFDGGRRQRRRIAGGGRTSRTFGTCAGAGRANEEDDSNEGRGAQDDQMTCLGVGVDDCGTRPSDRQGRCASLTADGRESLSCRWHAGKGGLDKHPQGSVGVG